MRVVLCENCFPDWEKHEVYGTRPFHAPCEQCGRWDQRHAGGARCHEFPRDPRGAKASAGKQEAA